MTFDGRQPSMKDKLGEKVSFDEWQHSMKENLCLMVKDYQWRTPLDVILPTRFCSIITAIADAFVAKPDNINSSVLICYHWFILGHVSEQKLKNAILVVTIAQALLGVNEMP